MADNHEHLLRWWSEKGHETLPVEWLDRDQYRVHLFHAASSGPAWRWAVALQDGRPRNFFSPHEAASLILGALLLALTEGGADVVLSSRWTHVYIKGGGSHDGSSRATVLVSAYESMQEAKT